MDSLDRACYAATAARRPGASNEGAEMNATAESTQSRVALVTGASRGIGRAAALALAAAGVHVVALARTQGGLEELDDAIRALRPGVDNAATLVPCDLEDFAAIDRLGEALFRRWGRLDVLLGAAGALGPLSPLHHVDPRQWEDVMSVNVTANWRLIRSLDPLLRRSRAGRVVFVTSGVASRAELRAYWGPYAVSKAALDALARTYAAETATTSGVRVMLVDPGALRTRMRSAAMPGEDPRTLRTPEDLAPKILALCSPDWSETGKLYHFPTDRVLSFSAPQ
jgi:NAD(P)-dependent dehydrogenase (short-subunit alcohol dehydrogenase family)